MKAKYECPICKIHREEKKNYKESMEQYQIAYLKQVGVKVSDDVVAPNCKYCNSTNTVFPKNGEGAVDCLSCHKSFWPESKPKIRILNKDQLDHKLYQENVDLKSELTQVKAELEEVERFD